jgi:hypothetical protein
MSGRFKRCKVCGTSKANDFAPRKSVICKNCDTPNVNEASLIQDLPLNNEPQSSVQETSQTVPVIIPEEKVYDTSLNIENLNNSEEIKESFAPPNTPETKPVDDISSSNLEEVIDTEHREQNHIYVKKEEFESILDLIVQLQNTVAQLQKDVILLGRLKNMFPLVFPKDEEI